MFKNFKPCRLLVTVGPSGSGKSFFSRQVSKRLGYTVLRSDVIRKELFGFPPLYRPTEDERKQLYSPEVTKKVYQTLIDRASQILSEGRKVILDATFLKRWQRELVLRRFPSAWFVWIYASEDEIKKRLALREEDPSDADFSVYLKQLNAFEPPEEVLSTFVVRSSEWQRLVPFLRACRT
jgi:gluconokinase